MDDTAANNRRIAKNTLVLYIRMLFLMVISLYTSSVVLNTLGVEDYGIYNVVGGVVAMFGFINSSMASATQRYITFALGKGDENRLKTVFSTALQIHAGIALLIVILGETVGLWFLYNHMQIPPDRLGAAFWVLQCSIVATIVMVISIPYNADIIAHEKMSAFAYISIAEGVLKLGIVFLLNAFDCDKLVLYAVLILCVQLLIRIFYGQYCHRHFVESRYYRILDRNLIKEMTGFAGWSIFGNLSAVLYGQGLNMLLNVFFGPIVNAARAVAVQVQSAIQQFVGNFQMALNPQITKTYAKGEMRDMHRLMFRSARFSFYLLFFLALPVLFETDFILRIWLKTVPDNSVIFIRIMICTSLIYALANPLITANQATGKVKKYQAVCGSILLMILPISYICLKLKFPAYSVFIVHFVMESVAQLARMIMLKPLIGLRVTDYLKNIYARVAIVTTLSAIVPCLVYIFMDNTILRFFAVCIACALSVGIAIYSVGLTNNERAFLNIKMASLMAKLTNR